MPVIKFSFVPERLINKPIKDASYRVTIFKSGVLCFPSSVVHIYDLEGKYVKMYADVEKKTIGWSIIEGQTSLNDLNGARLIKKLKSGCAVLGIRKLLKSIGIEHGAQFKNLETKIYKSSLNESDIFYIQLTKEI